MDREELLKEKDNTIPKETKYLLILLLTHNRLLLHISKVVRKL